MGKKKIKPEDVEESKKDEEEKEDREDEAEEGFFEEGENLEEIDDSSIGDMGLATANTESSWKGDLEMSLEDEPLNKWAEQHEEPDEEGVYQEGIDGREKEFYSEVEHTGGERGRDLYAADSGVYTSGGDAEGRTSYNPKIARGEDKDEIRSEGKSKLEIEGLQKGFGRGTVKDIRGKRDNKKYTN